MTPSRTQVVESELSVSYGTFDSWRQQLGSGGSTPVSGLDYRFDLTRSSTNGFIDDTHTEFTHLSTQLDYRASATFMIFGALEVKRDRGSAYWGTPLVSAAASGANGRGGIVSGSYVSSYNGTNLGAVTIDDRTLQTNYNVIDNTTGGRILGARRVRVETLGRRHLRDQVYYYTGRARVEEQRGRRVQQCHGLGRSRALLCRARPGPHGNNAALQWTRRSRGWRTAWSWRSNVEPRFQTSR